MTPSPDSPPAGPASGAGGPPPGPGPALLCNPESGRVAPRLDAVRRAGRALAGSLYREAVEPREIAAAVADATEAGADLLCVAGGDGTVHAVLTALEARRPDGPWPALAVAPGGTANMTARDLGVRGSPVAFLEALGRRLEAGGDGGSRTRRPAEGGTGLTRVRRPVLRVEGGGAGPLSGMFFGAGVVAAGVRYFRRRLDPWAVTGERVSALAVGRVLLGLAFGGETGVAAARPVTVSVDGGPGESLEGLLCLASTLDRLLLGTRPYWGEGEGRVHFTLVEKGARGLWRSLPRLALGRPGRRLTPERGYRSHEASRVELTLDGPFVLDGELYEARAAGGPLRISAERVAEWVVP